MCKSLLTAHVALVIIVTARVSFAQTVPAASPAERPLLSVRVEHTDQPARVTIERVSGDDRTSLFATRRAALAFRSESFESPPCSEVSAPRSRWLCPRVGSASCCGRVARRELPPMRTEPRPTPSRLLRVAVRCRNSTGSRCARRIGGLLSEKSSSLCWASVREQRWLRLWATSCSTPHAASSPSFRRGSEDASSESRAKCGFSTVCRAVSGRHVAGRSRVRRSRGLAPTWRWASATQASAVRESRRCVRGANSVRSLHRES